MLSNEMYLTTVKLRKAKAKEAYNDIIDAIHSEALKGEFCLIDSERIKNATIDWKTIIDLLIEDGFYAEIRPMIKRRTYHNWNHYTNKYEVIHIDEKVGAELYVSWATEKDEEESDA